VPALCATCVAVAGATWEDFEIALHLKYLEFRKAQTHTKIQFMIPNSFRGIDGHIVSDGMPEVWIEYELCGRNMIVELQDGRDFEKSWTFDMDQKGNFSPMTAHVRHVLEANWLVEGEGLALLWSSYALLELLYDFDATPQDASFVCVKWL